MHTVWESKRVIATKGTNIVAVMHTHNQEMRTVSSKATFPLIVKIFTIKHEITNEEFVILYVRNPLVSGVDTEIAALKLPVLSENMLISQCVILLHDMIQFMNTVQDPLESVALLSEIIEKISKSA